MEAEPEEGLHEHDRDPRPGGACPVRQTDTVRAPPLLPVALSLTHAGGCELLVSAAPDDDRTGTKEHAMSTTVSPELTDLPATMTIPEAAELLGVSRSAGYRAVASGEIPTIRIGRRLLVPTAKLYHLLGLLPEPTG